jgi:isopenicillin N synthase-like dioxygenase
MSITKYLNRSIPTISLHDYERRIDEITSGLVSATENVGFFCITDHGISRPEVDDIFNDSARFFALPDEVKSKAPFSPAKNAG